MNNKTLFLSIGNAAIIALAIIAFSKGILNLWGTALGWIAAAVLIVAFFAMNYFLLTYQKKVSKLNESNDYLNELENWLHKSTPFKLEISKCIKQLEQLERKKTALNTITTDGQYDATSNEVQLAVFTNAKRLINRLIIFDASDDIRPHQNYLAEVLENNDRVLSEFNNLIVEVSQIGDSEQNTSVNLDYITNALRELRTESENRESTEQKG